MSRTRAGWLDAGRRHSRRAWIRRSLLPASLVVIVGCLVSAEAFRVFFAADDFVYIAYAESRPFPGIVDAAAHRWLSGAGAFLASRALFGLDAALFHLPVAAAHIANALLLWRLVQRLEPTRPAFALVAALLFAGHAVAFTVLAWLSAGFNEAPALTAALLAVHLTLAAMERGSMWLACAPGVVVFLATGIKQHVVLAVAYVAMFGVYFGVKRPGEATRPWVRPLAASVLLVSGVAAWLALVVVPRMPDAFSKPPYVRVYAPASIAAGYLRYLPHALNPVAFAREPLGYQDAMPAGLLERTGTSPTAFRLVMLAAWAVAVWSSARRLGLLPLAGTAAGVLTASLTAAVVQPDHQHDYYAYFGLPAAAILAAMPIGAVWRVLRSDRLARRAIVPSAIALLLVGAWYQGLALAGANAIARHAQHARLVDRIAALAPANSTLYFMPPVSRVREDTLQGASVNLLRPDKALTVQFAETPGVPPIFAAHPGVLLIATRQAADGHWEGALLDHAQWRRPETLLHVAAGSELQQPFNVGAAGVSAIHIAVSQWQGSCQASVTIHAPGDGAPDYLPETVASGALDCRRHVARGVAAFTIPGGRLPPGKYVLRVRVDSGTLEFPVAVAEDIGFAPLSFRNRDAWEPRPHTLGIRGVSTIVRNSPRR